MTCVCVMETLLCVRKYVRKHVTLLTRPFLRRLERSQSDPHKTVWPCETKPSAHTICLTSAHDENHVISGEKWW